MHFFPTYEAFPDFPGSGANVTDTTPSGAYLTHDNGARPFKAERACRCRFF